MKFKVIIVAIFSAIILACSSDNKSIELALKEIANRHGLTVNKFKVVGEIGKCKTFSATLSSGEEIVGFMSFRNKTQTLTDLYIKEDDYSYDNAVQNMCR